MINKCISKEAAASPERDAALSYVFGCYGADMHMPFAYEETNQTVHPGKCCCVVMGKAEGEVFYDHLRRHYLCDLPLMKGWSDVMSEAFDAGYVKKYASDIVRVESEYNFQFGNLAFTRIDTALGKEYLLISPEDVMGVSLDNALMLTESYLISHGSGPDRPSRHTARAFERVAAGAMALEGNGLSGIYAFNRVAMNDGSVFIGFSPAENGHVNCHFQKHLPDSRIENTKRPLHTLSVMEMMVLIPTMIEFQKKFRKYLPSCKSKDTTYLRELSDQKTRPSKGMKF